MNKKNQIKLLLAKLDLASYNYGKIRREKEILETLNQVVNLNIVTTMKPFAVAEKKIRELKDEICSFL